MWIEKHASAKYDYGFMEPWIAINCDDQESQRRFRNAYWSMMTQFPIWETLLSAKPCHSFLPSQQYLKWHFAAWGCVCVVHACVHSNGKAPFNCHYPVKQRRSYLNVLNHNLLTISHNLLKSLATKVTPVVASRDRARWYHRCLEGSRGWGGDG